MLVDVAVAFLVAGTSTTSTEEVPAWLTYLVSGLLGSPVVLALGWVIVRAVAKYLGVQADTPQGNLEESPATRQGPEQSGQGAPVERYDAKMALLARMVEQQDERLDRLEATNDRLEREKAQLLNDLSQARADAAWNRNLLAQLMGQPVQGPQQQVPPSPPWPPQPGPMAGPSAGPSLGS